MSEDGPAGRARAGVRKATATAQRAAGAARRRLREVVFVPGPRPTAEAGPAPTGHARQEMHAVREDLVELRDDTAELRDEAAGHRDRAAEHRDGAGQALEIARAASAEAGEARDEAVRAVELLDGDPVLDEQVRHEEAGVDEDNPFGRPGRPGNRFSPFRVGFAFTTGAGMAYLLYQAFMSARSVLVLVLVAAFLAIGLNPMVSRLEQMGLRRGGAVGIVFLGLLAFFAAFGYAVLPPVVTQIANFVEALPGYVRDLQNNPTVDDLDERFGLVDRLNDYVTGDLGTQVAGNIVSIGQQLAGIVFKGLTVLILTLYFLSSFNAIKETAYRLVPRSRRARVNLIGDEILGRVGGYVAGAVVVALIAGTSTLVWVSSLGIPYPLALALIVALTDVIPLIGATIGAVVVTAVAFFVSVPVGIATGIFFLVYQQVENYLVYPRVMSRSVDVNPAAAIVGALVGGTLLGFVGALLAVPATAAIQLILREVLVPRQDAQ